MQAFPAGYIIFFGPFHTSFTKRHMYFQEDEKPYSYYLLLSLLFKLGNKKGQHRPTADMYYLRYFLPLSRFESDFFIYVSCMVL